VSKLGNIPVVFDCTLPIFVILYSKTRMAHLKVLSSMPRLCEQGIPRESEDGCWVGEAIILRIITPCGQNTGIQKKLTATYKQNVS